MRIALFPTCVVDAAAPAVGVATVRVLRERHHDVMLVEDATCCGQPAWNTGQIAAAAKVARATLDALNRATADAAKPADPADQAEVIVVPAGSCTTMIRVFWPELFELVNDHVAAEQAKRVGARTKELSEFLATDQHPGTDPTTRPEQGQPRLVYHRSCHMLRELGIRDQPERMLDVARPGGRATTTAEDRCCGFGGLFSVKLPELAAAMADEVLDAAIAADAQQIIGCDSSCLLHLEGRALNRRLPLTFHHLAEVLADPT